MTALERQKASVGGKGKRQARRPSTAFKRGGSDLVVLLALGLLLGGLLLYAASLPPTRLAFTVDQAPPAVTFHGFYGLEENAGGPYRWAKPEAALVLPGTVPADYRLTLALQDSPAVPAPRTVTVLVNGAPVGAVQLDATRRDYTFEHRLLPRDWAPGRRDTLEVELRADPFAPPGDQRLLGVIVTGVAIEPAPLPAPVLLALLAPNLLLLLLAYAALRAMGARVAAAAGALGLLVAAYALVAAAAREQALSLASGPSARPLWFLGTLLLLGALAPVARASSWQGAGGGVGERHSPSRPLVPVGLLTLWLALPAIFGALGDAQAPRAFAAFVLTAILGGWLAPAARPRLARAVYGLGAAALALCWRLFAGPSLAGVPDLGAGDRAAIAVVPWVIGVFGVATALLTALAPGPLWRPALLGDLGANLALLGAPALTLFAAGRPYGRTESDLDVAWLGGLLVLLIALKTLNGAIWLWRTAPALGSERRAALGILALCLAAYWSLLPWRAVAMGASGDEPGYLAAAWSLVYDRDFELTNNGYAPRMVALTRFPIDAWGNEVQDAAHDRLAAIPAAPLATTHHLPLVAGPELEGRVALANPASVPVDVTIRFYEHDRPEATATAKRLTIPPRAAVTVAPPASAGGWLGASVEAAGPIGASVRLAGDARVQDAYSAPPAGGQVCTPLLLPDGDWETTLFVHNPAARGTRVSVTRYGAQGEQNLSGALDVAARGGATLPLAAAGRASPGTVCASAEGPVATVLLARRPGAGLLALPGLAARAGTFPAPPKPAIANIEGTVTALLHNPSDSQIAITTSNSAGQQTAMIPPRGTLAVPIAAKASDEAQPLLAVETASPIMATYLLQLHQHLASYGIPAASDTAVLPAIVGRERTYVNTRVNVQNTSSAEVVVTAELVDAGGTRRQLSQFTLCGRCTGALRTDFADREGNLVDGEGAIVVGAGAPVTIVATQLEARTLRFYHEWGLAFLAAPGAALAGWYGALATIALAGAALAAQLYGLMRDAGIGRRVAVATTLVLALSSPLATFAVQFYPEVPATALLVTALRLGLGERSLRGRRLAGTVACLLAVPFLHARLLPLAAAVAAGLCWHWRRRWLRSGHFRGALRVVTVGVGIATPLVLALLWWGASRGLPFLPGLPMRLSPAYLRGYFSTAAFGHYLSGILLDRATGILPTAPVLLLAGAGLVNLLRRAPRYAVWIALLIGTHLGVVALRASGWEVWGPPGRYIFPIIPLLGVAVASAWACWSPRWLKYGGAALAAWGVLAATFIGWIPLAAYYFVPERKWFGDPLLRDWLGGNPLTIFPAIPANVAFAPRQVWPWLLLFALVTLAGIRWPRRLPRTRSTIAR